MQVQLKHCEYKKWYNMCFYPIITYIKNHKTFEVQRWKNNTYMFTVRRHRKYVKQGIFNNDEHVLTPKELKILKQMLNIYIYQIEIPDLLSQ